ncbi:MAG: FAD-binding protein, partial [Erythrobacter sp.]
MTETPKEPNSEEAERLAQSTGGHGISRRDLAKIGALTAGALAVPTVLRNVGVQSMADAPRGTHEADLIIIGSGFAGVFAALEARSHGQKVIMLDKGTVGWSGLSPWASDSRPFDPSIYDRSEWIKNLSINTEWVNDRVWTDIFLDESLDIFYKLREMGAHEAKAFERSDVFREALENADVQLIERTMVTSLLKDKSGKVGGLLGFTYDDSNQPCEAVVVKGKAVINCMGAGGYKSPGFPNWGQTFDGDAISYDAGANITGKEFHDTHQTFSNIPAASYDGWIFAQSVTGAYIMAGAPDPVKGGLNIESAVLVSGGKVVRDPNATPAGTPRPEGPNLEAIGNRSKYEGKGFLTEDNLTIDWGGPPEDPPPDGNLDRGFRVG